MVITSAVALSSLKSSSSRSVAILGGGISGLCTAFYLLRNAASHGVTINRLHLLESSSRFGGWLRTVPATSAADNPEDYFELGPRTLSTNTYAGTNVVALVDELGLAGSIKFVNKFSENFNKRYIVVDGRLMLLPNKPWQFLLPNKPFKPFVLYALKDLRTAKFQLSSPDEDLSVDTFFRHRFGAEIADYIVNSLCIGISGGDSGKLSVKSMFPNVFHVEQQEGSVVRGLLKQKQDQYKELAEQRLVKLSREQQWSVFSFRHGIQTLPNGLCDYLLRVAHNDQQQQKQTIQLMANTEVTGLKLNKGGGVHLTALTKDVNNNDGNITNIDLHVDHVFSTIPAFRLAQILTRCNDDDHQKSSLSPMITALQSIPTVHMALVSLEYDRSQLPDNLPSGFGFLIPSKEYSPVLGVTFDSCIFANANDTNDLDSILMQQQAQQQQQQSQTVKFTVMMGGYRFAELFGEPDQVDAQHLLQLACDAMKQYLHIDTLPMQYLVNIHQNCIPQYTLGHQQRVDCIERTITQHNLNLSITGSSYRGFSVPDCILDARTQANNWLQQTISDSDRDVGGVDNDHYQDDDVKMKHIP